MTFCSSCENKLDDSNVFCPACDTKVRAPESHNSVTNTVNGRNDYHSPFEILKQLKKKKGLRIFVLPGTVETNKKENLFQVKTWVKVSM